MIDIAPRYLRIISGILKRYIPDYEVRVFGSRVDGCAKKYSDLDMVVAGRTRLSKKILYLLKEEFEESDLPFRVDIMDWHAVSDDFRRIIKARYKVLQAAQASK